MRSVVGRVWHPATMATHASTTRPTLLHLVRHAHAGDPEAWTGDDSQRPLSAKGRRQADRLGHFLVRAGIAPDRLVSSPKVRAVQTAERIAAALGMDVSTDARLAGGLSVARLAGLVQELGARQPMLFGHDPDFSMLLSGLIGADGQVMRKGALATIDIADGLGSGSCVLRWLIPPELLQEDADRH